MSSLRGFLHRWRSLFRRRQWEAEMAEELRQHLELRMEKNLRGGLTAEEARAAALRAFGGVEQVKERMRDERGFAGLEQFLRDLRYAGRQARRSPGFTLVAALTLALGIGASTAIFSVVKAVLLPPSPFPDPDRLVLVWADNPSLGLGVRELPDSNYELSTWRTRAGSFEQAAGMEPHLADLSGREGAQRVGGVRVTANFFRTLGIQPRLGRDFTAAEEGPGRAPVAIISDRLWRSRFGGDRRIVGQTVTVNREPCTIVGVMPAGFDFPRGMELPSLYGLSAATDIWLLTPRGTADWANHTSRYQIAIGRLRAGVSLAQARAELEALKRREERDFSNLIVETGWSVWVQPLRDQATEGMKPVLQALLGAVGMLLLIACANVANLLLSRTVARGPELALRGALGASRGRVLRQLFAESLALSALGGVFGLVAAFVGIKAITHWGPPNLPRLQDATLSWPVIAFAIGVSFLASLLAGFVPAWRASRIDFTEAMKAAGRSDTSGDQRRLQAAIVAVETALAAVLLIGAGLVGRSLQRLDSVDPGFNPEQVTTFQVDLKDISWETMVHAHQFLRELRDQIALIPGVERAGAISNLPLGGVEQLNRFSIDGILPYRPDAQAVGEIREIAPGYFGALRIPVLEGRDIGDGDAWGKPPVCLINRAILRAFFRGTDPIGRRLSIAGQDRWFTVIGVVGDVRSAALEKTARPQIYVPYAQYSLQTEIQSGMTVVVRGRTPAVVLERAIRASVKALDAQVPVSNYRSFATVVDAATARPRFATLIFGLFAAVALAMTLVGLSGVVGYAVAQHTREIGIRLALGGSAREILTLVLGQGLRPMLAGLAAGLLAAFFLAQLLAGLLFETAPTDPPTFAGAALAIALTALLACWLPARRAVRVDPVVALRAE